MAVNETTGDIEIIAEGDNEAKIYSLKEDGAIQEAAGEVKADT